MCKAELAVSQSVYVQESYLSHRQHHIGQTMHTQTRLTQMARISACLPPPVWKSGQGGIDGEIHSVTTALLTIVCSRGQYVSLPSPSIIYQLFRFRPQLLTTKTLHVFIT